MDRSLIRVAVLGSTGSIGRQTLDVIRAHRDRFEVAALAAGRNVELLACQVQEFEPKLIGCLEPAALRSQTPDSAYEVADLATVASNREVDVVMLGMVGQAGLEPALAALESGRVLALANKEAMVMGGALLANAAARGGGEIRPVDSEHSAIWQCLAGEDRSRMKRLIVTASGGALRDLPKEELAQIGPEQALEHPTWNMGPRITIDSASLFNKGLEVIEARWLFDTPYEQIDVLLHRESIIHAMVEMVDGSIKAHLSSPDMRQPIQFALSHPDRFELELPSVDFARLGSLNFGEIDMERYPCLALALAAGRRGDTYPAAIAAADEVAVDAFLERKLAFTQIPELLADVLDAHEPLPVSALEVVMEADAWARQQAATWIKENSWT